jgi:hypothetical protein
MFLSKAFEALHSETTEFDPSGNEKIAALAININLRN